MNRDNYLIKIFITGIIIYIVLVICQNKIGLFKEEYQDMYFLNDSVFRGEPLDLSKLSKVKVSSKIAKSNSFMSKIDEKLYYNKDLEINSILTSNDVTDKKEVFSKGLELLSIRLNSDAMITNLIEKADNINLYYTCKSEYSNNNLNLLESINFENGYNTYLLFNKIKVIKVLNKSGKEITSGEAPCFVIVSVPKKDIMMYNSLKQNGTFSVSVLN